LLVCYSGSYVSYNCNSSNVINRCNGSHVRITHGLNTYPTLKHVDVPVHTVPLGQHHSVPTQQW